MSKAKHVKGWADTLGELPYAPEERPAGLLEQGHVRLKDVLVLPSHEDLDDEVVSAIAESFWFSGGGPFSPVIVRRVRKQEDGEQVIKIELVAGAQRLQAARLQGLDYINCVYIEGDENAARLVQIAEDLYRKHLTVVKRAELCVEWLSLAIGNFSGQLVQKGQRQSKPRIVRASRVLPAIGRSVEARRKVIERAVKIASISPEAKIAAKDAKLDNNQRALLKIAKAGNQKAQVKKVEQLAKRFRITVTARTKTRQTSASSSNAQNDADTPVGSPPVQSDEDTHHADEARDARDGDDNDEREGTPTSAIRDTTFDEMETVWDRECRKLWLHLPFCERERFLEKLSRAKCKAQVDVATFLRDVLRGRPEVTKRNLYAYGKSKGLTKATIRKALKDLSYPMKKRGGDPRRLGMSEIPTATGKASARLLSMPNLWLLEPLIQSRSHPKRLRLAME